MKYQTYLEHTSAITNRFFLVVLTRSNRLFLDKANNHIHIIHELTNRISNTDQRGIQPENSNIVILKADYVYSVLNIQ